MPTGLTFAAPAVLFGAAAVALPWLIHLILRPRPRRIRFPAMELLRPVLIAGRRASKLRNFWLLALRSLMLLLLAVLLAGPTCRDTRGPRPGAPTAAVLLVDDSLSMSYDPGGGATLWETAVEQAERLLNGEGANRSAVRWTLMFAGASGPVAAATGDGGAASVRSGHESDVEPLLAALHAHGEPADARPLGESLRGAAALLAEAPEPNRQLYVLTDLAAHAWRDAPRGLFADVEGFDASVMAASAEARSNLALQPVEGVRQVRPAGAPTALNVPAAAYVAGAQCRVIAEGPEGLLDRSALVELRAGEAAPFPLMLPPMPPGPHGLTLTLEPRDRLDFDQTRFAAIELGPRPTALLISDSIAPADADLTALILSNLIAPQGLEAALQPAELRIASPETLPEELPSPLLVVLAGRVELEEAARRRLLEAVLRGAQLLIVPSADSAAEWPGLAARLAESISAKQDDAVTTLQFEPDSPLAAARDEGLAELTRASVRKRLQVAPAAGAAVHARFADGSPALLSRPHGDGALWLLATSPDPRWSDLGARAAGLITLVHRLIAISAGTPKATANLIAGEMSTRPFATLPADGLVRVTRRAGNEAATDWVRIDGGAPQEPWPADRAGLYVVHARGETGPAAVYAVNWPAEESDTTPIGPRDIAELLGVDRVTQVLDDKSGQEDQGGLLAALGRRLPPEPALAVVLAGLFALELAVGNRARAVRAAASE